jgi:glutamate-1-semialdehyde aminotransferase
LPQARLRELYGNEYIDVLNGLCPVLFGHAPPLVMEVVACQPFSRSM